MTPTSAIPVTVPPEVEAFVNEVGATEPFREMLERACQTVPQVKEITASLEHIVDEDGRPCVSIDAVSTAPFDEIYAAHVQWDQWVIERFQPQDWEHFSLFVFPPANDAR